MIQAMPAPKAHAEATTPPHEAESKKAKPDKEKAKAPSQRCRRVVPNYTIAATMPAKTAPRRMPGVEGKGMHHPVVRIPSSSDLGTRHPITAARTAIRRTRSHVLVLGFALAACHRPAQDLAVALVLK